MKILVIEDEPRNIEAAKVTLKDHELTIAGSIMEAAELLEDKGPLNFDLILTDLMMPKQNAILEDYTQGFKNPVPEELPAGMFFALAANNLGVKTVICTDSNRHHNYFCAMLSKILFRDFYSPAKNKNLKVVYVEARTVALKAQWDGQSLTSVEEVDYTQPLIKDWAKALVEAGVVNN